ncbi:TetR/AcrR family transcriptional regulator [Nitrosomonas sp. JL21]|uniref:TetR/AcrR family transcriptional regulator n=1 Tax=Nitrosomonas sp. JL21 TaxID=153949 RepID=UPI001368F286|nr:TetR/AcrR family transcriptional regulator [Nitrosomonas sp. JL21]MXS78396.1 TetR/AcrR family transcriptional regulator [Nitrosomonas sp. JL21]
MNSETATTQRGRPRNFNQNDALEKAMRVFWRQGYEGASLGELTEAMGINKSSMYSVFGTKEELFRKAVEKYLADHVSFVPEALNEPTVQQALRKLFTQSVDFLTDKQTPLGCFVLQGALNCGQGFESIQQQLIAQRLGYESLLRQRFELAQTQYDLDSRIDAAVMAKYIATVHEGLSIQATSGATKEELMAVVEIVLNNFNS